MYGTGTILRHSFILDYYKQKQLKNENIHIKTVPISNIAKGEKGFYHEITTNERPFVTTYLKEYNDMEE